MLYPYDFFFLNFIFADTNIASTVLLVNIHVVYLVNGVSC